MNWFQKDPGDKSVYRDVKVSYIPLLKKILNHSFWLFASAFFGKLLMFFTNVIVARFTTVEVFGQFTMIKSTITTLEGFISGSVNVYASKYVAERSLLNKKDLSDHLNSLFVSVFAGCGLISIILILGAEQIVYIFFTGESDLIIALYIGGLLLISSSLSSLFQHILIGIESFKEMAFITLISSLISLPAIVFLVSEYDLYGSLIGICVFYLIDLAIKLFYTYKSKGFTFSIRPKNLLQNVSSIFQQSGYLLLSIIVNSLTFWYTRVMLLNTSNNFKDVAIYDAAFQLLTIVIVVTSTTTSVILPKFSKALASQQGGELTSIFNISLVINTIISAIFAAIVIGFDRTVLLLYGKEYLEGTDALFFLCLASIFLSAAYVYHRYFISMTNLKIILLANIVSSAGMFVFLIVSRNLDASVLAQSVLIYYTISIVVYILSKRMQLRGLSPMQ